MNNFLADCIQHSVLDQLQDVYWGDWEARGKGSPLASKWLNEIKTGRPTHTHTHIDQKEIHWKTRRKGKQKYINGNIKDCTWVWYSLRRPSRPRNAYGQVSGSVETHKKRGGSASSFENRVSPFDWNVSFNWIYMMTWTFILFK